MARVLVASTLAIFMLWNMEAFTPKWKDQQDRHSFFPLRPYEWAALLIGLSFLLVLAFVLLPQSFETELPLRAQSHPTEDCSGIANKVMANEFEQIMKPYFPYFLYVFGLWIGVVFPVFLVLLRRLRGDWGQWGKRRSRLDACLPKKTPSQGDQKSQSSQAFDELLVAFQDYVIGLKEVAERYLPLLLAISLTLLYEQLTTSQLTVTPTAVESGKLALWLLLGPAMIICVAMVAVGYQNAAHKVESGFRTFAEASAQSPGKADLLDRVISARAKLMWEESPASFVLSVAKSATISIPLLLAITVYVLHSLAGPEGWLGIFVPKAVINFVHGVFK